MRVTKNNVFLLAWEVARIVQGYAASTTFRKGQCWLEDRREQSVINPTTHQTKQGLFLEFWTGRYATKPGKPHALWTPWGEWSPWGEGGNWGLSMQSLLLRLGAKHYRGPWGSLSGIVYELTSVDGIALPRAFKLVGDEFRSGRADAWNTLVEKNRQLLGIPQLEAKA
jgi:hypothetical protein